MPGYLCLILLVRYVCMSSALTHVCMHVWISAQPSSLCLSHTHTVTCLHMLLCASLLSSHKCQRQNCSSYNCTDVLLNDSNVWSEVSREGFSYKLRRDMMSLSCSFHLLLWNAGHQIGRWNMTGCDIIVERRRLGLLGPLTHFRYLTWHFSKVVKIATLLPITGCIRKKKLSWMRWSAFSHAPCCHQCLTYLLWALSAKYPSCCI